MINLFSESDYPQNIGRKITVPKNAERLNHLQKEFLQKIYNAYPYLLAWVTVFNAYIILGDIMDLEFS